MEINDVRVLRRVVITITRSLRDLGRGDRAAAMIEYALIAMLIAVAAIAGVQALSGAIGDNFVEHQDSVTEEMQGGPSSP